MSDVEGAIRVRNPDQDRIITKPFVQLCLANLSFFSSTGVLIPLLPIYAASIGGSGIEVGLVISLFAVAAIGSRPFAGRLVDRGSLSLALLIGGTLYTVSSVSYALASVLWLLYFIRLVHGLGLSYFTTATGTIAAGLAPRHKRGAAVGIFSSSQSLGIGLAPALSVALMQATSFSFVFMVSGLLALASLVLSTRVRLPKAAPLAKTPLRLYSRSALMPAAVFASVSMVHGAATTFLPIVAVEKGMGNPGLFFTIYGVTVIACRLLAGPLSDRFGRAMVIVPGLFLIVAGTIYFSTITDLMGILVSGALFGFGTGLANPGLMALTIDRASADERGSAVGTFMASFDVGIALGAVVGGLMIPYFGFSTTFAILSFSPLLALAGFVRWGIYGKSQLGQEFRR